MISYNINKALGINDTNLILSVDIGNAFNEQKEIENL